MASERDAVRPTGSRLVPLAYVALAIAVTAVLVGRSWPGAPVGFFLAYVVAFGGFFGFLIASVCRPASRDEVEEFARLSGIETTHGSQMFIAYYLVTGRRLRAVLVLAAVFLPSLVSYALGLSDDIGRFPSSWQAVLAACVAGTIWAELALTRPAGKVRVASLRPRDTASYLGRPLRWLPLGAGGLAAGVWVQVSRLPARTIDGLEQATRAEIVTGIVFALVVPALVALTQRWIVSRPQPFSIPSLVAADDAIRAASLRYLGAVGAAMALLNLSGAAVEYLNFHDGSHDILFGFGSLASLALAWFCWNARKPGRLMRSSRDLRPSRVAAG